MKHAILLLLPALAFSQVPLRNVTGSVCSLQIHDRSTSSLLERTNDWTVVRDSLQTLWPSANFLLSLESVLYGANGELCSFSPYLNCKIDATSARLTTLTLAQNTSIKLNGKSKFWICPDPDGDSHHATAAPLIYPPKGFLVEADQPKYATCNATSLYSATCLNDNDFTVNPERVVLNSDPSRQVDQTGDVSRQTWSIPTIVVALLASVLF